MTRALRSLIALMLWWPLLASAAPRAWLDRDSIRMGETVTLNVETDARGGSDPDFSVLDANFRRLGTQSSTQLSWVNGKQSARTTWGVALEPLQEGIIGIPALAVGNESTAPLSLRVLPMPSGGSAAAGSDVFLEVDAEPSDPYVQQQVRYAVRLYYAVPLLEGQLEDPQAAGARVSRIGQDVQYHKMVGERRYTVVERRFAIVPEASGPLEIPGLQFRGRTLRTSGYGSLMSPSAILSARGDALALDVRPRPAQAPTPWLPARTVNLVDESGAVADTLKVGEPYTLVLRAAGQGLAAEQLPELSLPAIEGAEVYPDQETSQTGFDGEWLRGERVRKFAIVPTRAGTLRLPEVGIDWWNVDADRAERASLPARQLPVADASGNVPAEPARPVSEESATEAVEPAQQAPPAPHAIPWWPLLTATFALLWVGTLLWRRRVASEAPARSPVAPRAPTPAEWKRTWGSALDAADLPVIAQRLVAAVPPRLGSARHLADVVAALDDEAQRDAVAALERMLYAGHDDEDLIARLRAEFSRGPRWRARASNSPPPSDDLPPLYPSHR